MAAVDPASFAKTSIFSVHPPVWQPFPRATMDQAALKRILKLTDNQLPIMNNPVGYPRK